MKIAEIARIIEAVLFVSGDGVDRDEFKRIYDMSDKELNKCLDIIKEKYSGDSGVHLISFKNKIQLCSNPALADNIAEILNPIRERSLTKAALETVAIVAYKQPITRTEIEQIRGVNCDYAVQLLQSNNLIQVVGRKDAVGKPLLFGTTDDFLKRFELNSLDELPNYKDLLDRIRVIHSEGDSLYREFTIPDEEANDNVDNVSNYEQSPINSPEVATVELETEGVEYIDKTKEAVDVVVSATEIAENNDGDTQLNNEPQEVNNTVENEPIEDKLETEVKKAKACKRTKKSPSAEQIEVDTDNISTNNINDDKFSIDNFDMHTTKVGRRKNLIESLQTLSNDDNQVSNVIDTENNIQFNNIEANNVTSNGSNLPDEQPVKLSWKDKLKLRLAEQQSEE